MPFDDRNPDNYFECTQCGECCKGYGGTYVSESDIIAIADYLNLPVGDVKGQYCALSGKKMLLAQRPDGFCVFWGRNCTIHPVKPLMCRRWPFIPSLLVDPSNWRIMAASCPGIKPDADPEALLSYVGTSLGGRQRPPG